MCDGEENPNGAKVLGCMAHPINMSRLRCSKREATLKRRALYGRQTDPEWRGRRC